jgi:hypothetical protein
MRATLVALLIAAGGKLLADEAKEWLNWLPAKLIRWAAKQFPLETQPRIQEEWLAHCNDLPGNLSKVWHAIGCASTSVKLTQVAARTALIAIFLPSIELDTLITQISFTLRYAWYWENYNPWPEAKRARRLRQSAGGLVVLGLDDLELRPSDWEEQQIRPKREEKWWDAAAKTLGQVLAPATQRAEHRYLRLLKPVWERSLPPEFVRWLFDE